MLRMLVTLIAYMLPSASHAESSQHFEIYGAKTFEDLRRFKAWGLDQLILEDSALLEAADEMGFRVIQANWFNRNTQSEVVQARVDETNGLRNLVSINLMDEPIYNGATLHPPETYMAIRQSLRQNGLNQSLSLTEHGPRETWTQEQRQLFARYLPAIDHLRIDPYPVLSNRPLRMIYDWIVSARSFMGTRSLPLTVILQTWSEGTPIKLPTIAQLRVMSFLASASEVECISFFDYNSQVWNSVPGFGDGFQTLIGELREFANATRGTAVTRQMSARGILDATFWSQERSQVHLKINTNGYSEDGMPPYAVLWTASRSTD